MATAYLRGDSVFAYPPHLPPRDAIEAAVETLMAVLDAMDGDGDQEPDFNEDDALMPCWWGGKAPADNGAGCSISDPGGCEHDGREPDHDAEVETWSHWMDHAPDVHIGLRPGWNGPERSRG